VAAPARPGFHHARAHRERSISFSVNMSGGTSKPRAQPVADARLGLDRDSGERQARTSRYTVRSDTPSRPARKRPPS